MATVITKQLAEAIAIKLRAVVKRRKRKAHDLAVIYHGDLRVVSFGIRRGSRRDAGHDHVMSDLHLSPHDCRRLAQCPMSREEWIAVMTDRGVIPRNGK